MAQDILSDHRKIWTEKPALRAIYHDYYRRMTQAAKPGVSLEIGGGTGNFKEFFPEVISSDIVPMPWLDSVCDAQKLPFKDQSFDNIFGIDILHHIENPVMFFEGALRVLKNGGRIILLEPAITPVSYLAYKLFHTEPVDISADPFAIAVPSSGRKPFDANQAIPELLFGKHREKFLCYFTRLQIIQKKYLSLWAYPLSGGFQHWSLLPGFFAAPLLNVEKFAESALGRLLGFKILIVLEKNSP